MNRCKYNKRVGCNAKELCDACEVYAVYQQGRADAFKEIAYSDDVKKEEFEILAYNKGRADAIDEFVKRYKKCDERCTQCHKCLNCADCIAEQMNGEADGKP